MFSWDVAVTGLVGLAGIAGTLWQGKKSRESQSNDLKLSIDAAAENLHLSLKAEDDRNKISEKRRIYARCVASLDNFADKAIALGAAFKFPNAERRMRSIEEYGCAVSEISVMLSELMLLAPESVGSIARDIYAYFLHVYTSTALDEKGQIRGDATERLASEFDKLPDKYRKMSTQLYDAMRTDLGESTWSYRIVTSGTYPQD